MIETTRREFLTMAGALAAYLGLNGVNQRRSREIRQRYEDALYDPVFWDFSIRSDCFADEFLKFDDKTPRVLDSALVAYYSGVMPFRPGRTYAFTLRKRGLCIRQDMIVQTITTNKKRPFGTKLEAVGTGAPTIDAI